VGGLLYRPKTLSVINDDDEKEMMENGDGRSVVKVNHILCATWKWQSVGREKKFQSRISSTKIDIIIDSRLKPKADTHL
jgi:hypothetical protein